jgi:hypothetical protein
MSLLRTIDQFQAYVKVNYSTDLEDFGPDLRLAERQRVRPILGPALYNELNALPDADMQAALDDKASATGQLLQLVHEAVANLGALEYLPLSQVKISSAGIAINVPKTAFQWQIGELRVYFRRKGYDALEAVLAFLGEHASDFPAWETSAAATEARRQLLATAADFSRYYDIGSSQLTYRALLPTLRRVERFRLGAVLGAAYLAELRAELVAGVVSADNQLVLEEYVRPALASLTVALAIPEVGIGLSGGNLELNVYRFDNANEKEADASIDKLLMQKVAQAETDGQAYLLDLRTYLNANASATRYASYFNSAVYRDPTSPRPVVTSAVDSPTYGFF